MTTPSTPVVLTPWWRVGPVALALSVVLGLILLAFSWPAVTAEPKDVPVGIVGTDAQVTAASRQIEDKSGGAVALKRQDDRATAVAAIKQREVYGAIVLAKNPTNAPEVLIATAANPQVAQMLNGIAQQLQSQVDTQIREQVATNLEAAQASAREQAQELVTAALAAVANGQLPPTPQTPQADAKAQTFEVPVITVKVTDIAPFLDSDPRGAGLTTALFPLVFGGMIGGIALSLLIKGPGRRAVGVVVYAAAAGVALAGILQFWFGALQGSFAVNATAIGLSIGAISGIIAGLVGVLGIPGIPLGAIFILFFANPISGATLPVEFIASPWGAIGQWLPPGAAATLVRNLTYFPEANTVPGWSVLGAWALLGLVLCVIAARRTPKTAAVTA